MLCAIKAHLHAIAPPPPGPALDELMGAAPPGCISTGTGRHNTVKIPTHLLSIRLKYVIIVSREGLAEEPDYSIERRVSF